MHRSLWHGVAWLRAAAKSGRQESVNRLCRHRNDNSSQRNRDAFRRDWVCRNGILCGYRIARLNSHRTLKFP